MAPTIVLEDGVPILATGASGGVRIGTSVAQAILGRLVFGLDPAAAVSAPRVFTEGSDLLVDPDVPVDVRDGLKARGETVRDEAFLESAVQMIAWERQGAASTLLSASDPRKGGLAAAR